MAGMTPIHAFIGLGSNLDDPAAQLQRAFGELSCTEGVVVLARSSLYRSAPVGFAAQPDFVNAAALVATTLPPRRLLAVLHAIEAAHGRRRAFRNGPRTLDLDLLLYGGETMDEGGLVLPHPAAHERAFVLEPLLEIAPDCVIPGRGAARACLAALRERCLGVLETSTLA
ncbi:MAG: 2-amino-4-hydroxy-6-hydroxymethyldihydropteridine diphosphokinase [Zoogloeaceae bacterium]|nr:2-amino-4-hydroxy-6-hydroxymethyldihydropteridine diphosphokinase [Zoogloeaceae bacterium]